MRMTRGRIEISDGQLPAELNTFFEYFSITVNVFVGVGGWCVWTIEMPASGPVYQPTTVSYEQQSEWSQPSNGLINRTLNHIRNPRWFHWSFILISWILIAIGVFLFLSITTNFVSSDDKKDNYTEDIAFLVIGSFCFVFGVVLLIGYFRYIKDKDSCPCFTGKARQMETQSQPLSQSQSNGQVRIVTLNENYCIVCNRNKSLMCYH